jgi:HlyD family secretion protein
VQHATGGIVAQLLVREGQAVATGEVLLRLDDTQARASLGLIQAELTAALVRRARLIAERDGAPAMADPPMATPVAPDHAAMLDGERRLFAARADSRAGQKAQLQERMGQLREEIVALEAQIAAHQDQLRVAMGEIEGVRMLLQRGLVQRARVTQLERETIRLRGSIAEIAARIAATKGRMAEITVQSIQLDRTFAAEVAGELREVETRIASLQERRLAAEDGLARVEVRAPVPGLVHQLQAHTVGGVIGPVTPIMTIVPSGEDLVVEARVAPRDIDQVVMNGQVRVRISALSSRQTPEVTGAVIRRSADAAMDPRTGLGYFTVAVRLLPGEAERLAPHRILAGMPAEVFVLTAERTLADQLSKPLRDQLRRALSEE